ncbi:MAG TPA: hypothetical protein VH458_10490 [Vicinamibacterales bacterium]|jgi:hypothetical protein
MRVQSMAIAAVIAGALTIAVPAFAGPPLLCHPFDIGQAQSLPWNGTTSWSQGQAGYDVQHVIADTDALLTPATPVIVRMETLRRAVIYASQDAKVASSLLEHVLGRVKAAETAGHPDALAYLDAAYVAEAMREVSMLGQSSEFRDRANNVRPLVQDGRGYALIQRGLALRPDDPALHFAAALIAADGNRSAYVTHAAKARAGASGDPLLARNIDHVS